jgi:lipocalin/mannose-6-phosphate isomerase-like protein (cupin superfamily)
MGSQTSSFKGVKTDWYQYLGDWYEQARIPTWFEPSSTSFNTKALYQLNSETGDLTILNTTYDAFGTERSVQGTARIDDKQKGLLHVSFFEPFEGTYVVLDHDPNYTYSIVAGSNHDYLWFLTRSKDDPSPQLKSHFLQIAKRNGFDLTKIEWTPKLKQGGAKALVLDLEKETKQNQAFRKVLKTGLHEQLVLMQIPKGSEVGMEIHPKHDQFIKIEKGQGYFEIGKRKKIVPFQDGFAAFVPANTWHNVKASGSNVSLYSVYAPPHIFRNKK